MRAPQPRRRWRSRRLLVVQYDDRAGRSCRNDILASLSPRSISLPVRCIAIRRKGRTGRFWTTQKAHRGWRRRPTTKTRLPQGKNRSTLLPNIPPHTEIKVTAEGLGARPALLPAQQPRQLGEVHGHPAALVPGQSIGDGAPDSAKRVGDLQRLELRPGMAPRCSLHGCCRMNPVRAICRGCRRLL